MYTQGARLDCEMGCATLGPKMASSNHVTKEKLYFPYTALAYTMMEMSFKPECFFIPDRFFTMNTHAHSVRNAIIFLPVKPTHNFHLFVLIRLLTYRSWPGCPNFIQLTFTLKTHYIRSNVLRMMFNNIVFPPRLLNYNGLDTLIAR